MAFSKQIKNEVLNESTAFRPAYVRANMSTCNSCGLKFTSVAATVQHLANSGCNGSAICYCHTKITMANAPRHILTCRFFGPIGCSICPGINFKTLERANNHAWSAHGTGHYTPEIQQTVIFKLRAQVGTRFAHMQYEQVLERTRDNIQKRAILKTLIKESDFTAPNSHIFRLSAENKHRKLPCFSKTQGRLRDIPIKCKNGNITVCINLDDLDVDELWLKLRPHAILKAQGLFSVDHNVNHSMDPILATATQQITTILERMAVATTTIQAIVSLTCKLIAMVASKFNTTVVAALVIDALTTIGISGKLAAEVWNRIKDHFRTVHRLFRGELFAQVSGDPIVSLVTIVSVFCGTMMMKQIPRESEINDCINGATKLGGLVRGLTFAWQGLENLVTFVMKRVFEWHTGVPAELETLETFMSGISTWFGDVQELVRLNTADDIACSSEKCAHIETLYRQGVQFSVQANEVKVDRSILQPFNLHFAILKNLYDKATASGAFRSGPRIEPVVIYVFGGSGTGKSGLMFPLATELLKVDGMPETDGRPDPTKEIYMRNVEQVYWDGYKWQRIVIYDDFSQIVDSASKNNPEFMEIIRTGNLAPYPLHMASIEEKSKTYFKSRVVLCTSNMNINQIRPESIHCKEALRRRFDVCVRITNKPKFVSTGADGKKYLDPAKVESITGQKHSMEVYDVWPVDPLTGEDMTTQPISYDEFAILCLRKYNERFNRSADMFEFLRTYAEAPCLLRAQGLTLDEENEWLTNQEKEIEMIGNERMGMWKYPETQSFHCESYRHLREFMTSDATFAFDEFFGEEIEGETWSDYEKRWASTCANLNEIWSFDISARIRAAAMRDIYLRTSLTDVVVGLKERIVSGTRRVHERMVQSLSGWKEKVEAFFAKARKVLSEHPFLAIGCAIVPFVLFALSSLRAGKKIAVGPPLDHNHSGIKRGERVVHRHKCLWCDEIYQHAHTIKSTRESVEHPQLCGTCDRLKISCTYETSTTTGLSGFILKRATEEKFVPFDIISPEITSSGDPKTKRREALRVELTGSGDFHTKKKAGLRVEIETGDDYTWEDPEIMKAELETDPNGLQVSRKILNNMYNIELKINGSYRTRMKMCFIVGRTAITAAHLIPYLEQSTEVRIWNQANRQGHVMPTKHIKWVKVADAIGNTKDQVLLEFPRSIQDHSDITGNIATSTELTKFSSCHGVLIVPCDMGAIMRFGTIISQNQEVSYDDDKENHYTIRDRYEYRGLETKDGDCGAILMGVSSGLARKILGLHVAGAYGYGVSTPFNIADIRRALDQISLSAQVKVDWSPILKEDGTVDQVTLPEGNFTPVGKAIFTVSSPSNTALRPSAIHGAITPATTMPSALRPVKVDGKRVDPMMQGLKKAGNIPPFLDETRLAACVNDVERIVNSNIDPDHKRVLTDMEAIAGVEEDPFISPINRKSSPGFPYAKEKGGLPGKMKWLGSDEYKYDPALKEDVDKMIENARDNRRTPVVWTDTLKDERRPIAKVKIGKTRVFSAGPMHYTVGFRKYFLGFAAHCAKNRIDNEISIGTNVYSHDWTRTAKKLCSKGDKVIAGDFSNFDGTLLIQILSDVVEIINKFYDDGNDNAQIRRVLWKEIVNSVHLNGDNVYLWTHSQPSGCPITAILNSLFNSISMRYVWMTVMPQEYQTMRAFNKHVSMVSYGDDNCVNISDEVIELFNQLTIADGYTTMGMTYTDEEKSGEMIPYRSIAEISYLKRRFVWDEQEHQYLAPLDIGVVLEMVNWVRGDFDHEERTTDNLETSAFELSLHGKQTFAHWTAQYVDASRNFMTRPLFLTFEEYRTVEAQKYGRLAACSN